MSTIRITVPFDVNRLSPNQRLHWAERARRTQAVKDAARYAWMQAGSPVLGCPVRVSLVVRRGRVIDRDNALSGAKPALDSLFNRAITPDDSAQWVTLGGVELECGKAYRDRPEVEFLIEPLEPPPAGAAAGAGGVAGGKL